MMIFLGLAGVDTVIAGFLERIKKRRLEVQSDYDIYLNRPDEVRARAHEVTYEQRLTETDALLVYARRRPRRPAPETVLQ